MDDNKREQLQKAIFTRFLQQRLRNGGHTDVKITDLITDVADGTLLIKIVECLSGQKYEGKALKPSKMRILQINNAGVALKFVKSKGIDFKTSPENLVDGHSTFILGMVFRIIIKYMKLDDDDDESADVKEALRLWVLNKIQKYDIGNNNEVKTLTKPFHNGLIFCALIHHMRPKLIDFDSLKADNKKENLELALSVAEKYCNVQRYISVSDIAELDELGMVVYVYDWYYGISLLRKQDIAARRIGKLADMTKLHDEMKLSFDSQVQSLTQWIEEKGAWLEGHEITNTFSGVQDQIEDFFSYKTDEKAAKLVLQMDIGALFDNLALRLHNNKRVPYAAPISVEALEQNFEELAQTEAATSNLLHNELARQNNLIRLSERVANDCAKVTQWLGDKTTILNERPQVESVADAEMEVESHKFLEESNKSSTSLRLASIENVVNQLVEEKYENANKSIATKDALVAALDALNRKSAEKKAWATGQLDAQLKINDTLCKQFATAAADFESWLKQNKDAAANKNGTLESQLKAVESVLGSDVGKVLLVHVMGSESKLASLSECSEKISQRHIVINPYTQATHNDLAASSQQFKIASEKRKQLLVDEIRRRDANGISDAQLAEVNDNFDYFDKDKSGALDSREMRMCLQSLGEEVNPADVKAAIAKYDKDRNGMISRDEFKAYMLTRLGDNDSQDEIMAGFSLLAIESPAVMAEQLEAVVNELTFKERHVSYLKQEMGAKDGGYDHVKWTAEVFSR